MFYFDIKTDFQDVHLGEPLGSLTEEAVNEHHAVDDYVIRADFRISSMLFALILSIALWVVIAVIAYLMWSLNKVF